MDNQISKEEHYYEIDETTEEKSPFWRYLVGTCVCFAILLFAPNILSYLLFDYWGFIGNYIAVVACPIIAISVMNSIISSDKLYEIPKALNIIIGLIMASFQIVLALAAYYYNYVYYSDILAFIIYLISAGLVIYVSCFYYAKQSYQEFKAINVIAISITSVLCVLFILFSWYALSIATLL